MRTAMVRLWSRSASPDTASEENLASDVKVRRSTARICRKLVLSEVALVLTFHHVLVALEHRERNLTNGLAGLMECA
jgi:hypothetical protein